MCSERLGELFLGSPTAFNEAMALLATLILGAAGIKVDQAPAIEAYLGPRVKPYAAHRCRISAIRSMAISAALDLKAGAMEEALPTSSRTDVSREFWVGCRCFWMVFGRFCRCQSDFKLGFGLSWCFEVVSHLFQGSKVTKKLGLQRRWHEGSSPSTFLYIY